jgi:mannose-1-phosphate guanylyltransferase
MAVAYSLRDVDIAVLAGGLGTRVASVLGGLPKILAPIAGRPFLDYLVAWLAGQGASRILLCLGYRAEAVQQHLRSNPDHRVNVEVLVEPSALGTAGAVAFASARLTSDPVMVLNGDTYVEADLAGFLYSHLRAATAVSVLCARVPDAGRFGSLEIDAHDRVARFVEKDDSRRGESWISAGVYLFRREFLARIARLKTGSLEHDVLEGLPPGKIHAVRTLGRFVDIGTPESLEEAGRLLRTPGVLEAAP